MVRQAVSLLAALALLSSSIAAAPGGGEQQLVFSAAAEEAAVPATAGAPQREPDFVDVLKAEAEAQGIELDLGLDHEAQRANEAAFKAAQAAAAADDEDEHWGTELPDGDLALIADMKEAAEHAAELYKAKADAEVRKDPAAATAAAPWNGKASGEPGSGWVWKTCGQASDSVEVHSIDVTPDPPKPGQNMTVRGKGIVKSLIADGSYADVVVKIGLIKLLSRRFDLCEEARNANASVQCPVQPGEYDIEHTVALPREIPPAKFNVHLTGSTQDDVDLMCLDLSINFMHF